MTRRQPGPIGVLFVAGLVRWPLWGMVTLCREVCPRKPGTPGALGRVYPQMISK